MFPFQSITIPQRQEKPRQQGVTMVLDKNLAPKQLDDLLRTAGHTIDILKIGWGSSRVTPMAVLQEKLSLLRDYQVRSCPGGTLLELAALQGVLPEVLREAQRLGFSCVEISDGTVEIAHSEKLKMISMAIDCGFEVLSEVGKKSPIADHNLTFQKRIEEIGLELEAGVWKVILEAREAGTVGIFGSNGRVISEYVDGLSNAFDIDRLLFEAPQSSQQVWLIEHLGREVNLGNIAPEGAINLETLRCGLRSDTLLRTHGGEVEIWLENGVPGARRASRRGDVCVVIDALRASSTIIAALAAGIRGVRPVADPEECHGELTAGERLGEKLPWVDFDNSPVAFHGKDFDQQELVFASSNGTACINTCADGASAVLIGSMLNLSAVARRARQLASGRGISLVMAGRRGGLATEDLLVASEIVRLIGNYRLRGDYHPIRSADVTHEFVASGSGENLKRLGREEDVLFCAKRDLYDVVPERDPVSGLIVLG